MKQKDSSRYWIFYAALFALASSIFLNILLISDLEVVYKEKKDLEYTLLYDLEKVSETEEKDRPETTGSSICTQIQQEIK